MVCRVQIWKPAERALDRLAYEKIKKLTKSKNPPQNEGGL
jgi:hypothetical protein